MWRRQIASGEKSVADLQTLADQLASPPQSRPCPPAPAPSNVWTDVLVWISGRTSQAVFSRWFSQTAFVEDAGDCVTVRVPNELCRDWLTKHYAAMIVEAMTAIGRSGCRVQLSVIMSGPPE